MQALLHMVNHHADASVNSWLLETNDAVIILIIAVLSISQQETKDIFQDFVFAFIMLITSCRVTGHE